MPVEVCKRGHPRTPENTYVQPSGHPYCRVCRRISDNRRRKRPERHEYDKADKRRRYHAQMLTPEGRWMHRRWQQGTRLRSRRREIDRRLAEQPTTQLGEAVRREINRIEEAAWLDIASRMK